MNLITFLKCTDIIILNLFFSLVITSIEPDFFQPPTLHHTENMLKEKAVVFKFISLKLATHVQLQVHPALQPQMHPLVHLYGDR